MVFDLNLGVKFVRMTAFSNTDFHTQNFYTDITFSQSVNQSFQKFFKIYKSFVKLLLVFFKCFVKCYQIF